MNMAVDIANGDYLVLNGRDYPVRSVAVWTDFPRGASASFRRMARYRADTRRAPDTVAGKRSAAAIYLTNLSCTPLDPVSPETAARLELKTPYTLAQVVIGDREGFVHVIVEVLP